MATGGAHAPIKDALSRPITAGGFVDGAPVIFLDITKQSGLDKFHHRSGRPEKSTIIDAPGSGVALLDYDNDGWLDIYLLNGSTVPAIKGKERPPRAMLFHNNHDGTFTDVTDKAGVANERWGFGVAVADYDNDGWPDIYVANYGKNRLYHNNHDGTFTDVAERARVTLGGWSSGPTWGDYDHDGLLDLFVPGYVRFDLDRPIFAGKNGVPEGACQYRGVNVFCGPVGLLGETDHLFHNNGNGTFTDVTQAAGMWGPSEFSTSAAWVDYDRDGKLDLVVANYVQWTEQTDLYCTLDGAHKSYCTPESYKGTSLRLWHNLGAGKFEDATQKAGLGDPTSKSLGIAVLDFNGDGWPDIVIANDTQPNKLYLNKKDGTFEERGVAAGIGFSEDGIARAGMGADAADYDRSGHASIIISNFANQMVSRATETEVSPAPCPQRIETRPSRRGSRRGCG